MARARNNNIVIIGADGPQGPSGGGTYAFEIDANGDLLMHFDDNMQEPPLSINEQGDLIYTFS